MTTTVRITTEAKERLRRLQREWESRRGEAPTQQDVLDAALRYADDHRDEFLRAAGWRPLSPARIRALERRIQGDFGNLSEGIDETVYGD